MSAGAAGARRLPGGGDRVQRQRDGGVADRVVVQLEAGRGGGDRRLDEALRLPDGRPAEAGPVRIRLGQIAGVRLDHAVDEELDAGGADQRAREAGPHLRRRLQLLVQRQVGVEHHVEAEPRRELVRVLEPQVRVEHGLPRVKAGLVHERRAVARRDLALEVPQRLRPLRDRVLRQRPLHPGERLVEQALGRAVRQTLDDGAVPAGVVPADPARRSSSLLTHCAWTLSSCRHTGRSGTTRSMAAAVISSMGTWWDTSRRRGWPAARGAPRRTARRRSRHSCTERQSARLDLEELEGGEGRVQVRVAEAGQDEAAAEVHGPRARTGHSAASAALPSAAIRPSLTARASWRDRRASTVYTDRR